MIKKINNIIHDYIRGLKRDIARKIWDKSNNNNIIKSDNFIKDNFVNSILIMRDDGKIGDMVVNSFMFRELKKEFPNIKIGVVTRGGAIEIIKENMYVDKIYVYKKNYSYLKKLANKIAEDQYDLLIDFSLDLRDLQIMFRNKCKARINLGINKDNWELFNINITDKGNEHIVNRYLKVLKFLGIDEVNTDYDIQINSKIENEVENKLISSNKFVVLNAYAASRYRNLNKDNVIKILNVLLNNTGKEIYLIGENKHFKEISDIIKTIGNRRVNFIKLNGILEVAALIKKSELVITPDTSIVHIAVAFKKKLIAIYRKNNNDNNSVVWGPNSKNAIQIFSVDEVKPGLESDINKFNIDELERAVQNETI